MSSFDAGCILCSSSVSRWLSPSPWLGLTSILSPRKWSTSLTKPTPPGGWAVSVCLCRSFSFFKAAPAATARAQRSGIELVLLCRPASTFTTLTWATWKACVGPYWRDPSCQKCKILLCVCVRTRFSHVQQLTSEVYYLQSIINCLFSVFMILKA